MSISLQTLLDLPEIQALKGVPAGPPEHHPEGDAFAHTEMVVNLVLGMVTGNYSEDLCDIALVAAALHDVGKAKTDPKRWPKHYGHQDHSSDMSNELCFKVGLIDEGEMGVVWAICRYHHSLHRASELTDAAWRRIFKALHWGREYVELYVIVCRADAEGRGDGKPMESYPAGELCMTVFERLYEEWRSGYARETRAQRLVREAEEDKERYG